jgi:hypothetical protein
MKSDDKRIVKLLFRVSKGRKAHKNMCYQCRLCFKNIEKGQAYRLIEEEYGEMRDYLVHTKCLNKGEEKGLN